MGFLSKEIILGLTVQEFLLHMLNFAILFIALRLLLYKPVKKFMDKRDKEYKEAAEKYEEAKKSIADSKRQSEDILDEAREEAVNIAEEAHALSMVQNEEILAAAREEAQKIVAKANDEAAVIKAKNKEDMMHSVNTLAVDISKKILDRELTDKDTDKFIGDIIDNLEDKNA